MVHYDTFLHPHVCLLLIISHRTLLHFLTTQTCFFFNNYQNVCLHVTVPDWVPSMHDFKSIFTIDYPRTCYTTGLSVSERSLTCRLNLGSYHVNTFITEPEFPRIWILDLDGFFPSLLSSVRYWSMDAESGRVTTSR